MRTRAGWSTLVVAIVAALAAAPAVHAGSSTDRATGGGQILVGSRGAGDTIAFSAQGTADSAKGQVQHVERSAGTGKGQTVRHGEVSCLVVMGNTAKASGTWRGGGFFQLVAEDNGEGGKAMQADMIFIETMAPEPSCDFDDPEQDDLVALARGNVQVYDAG